MRSRTGRLLFSECVRGPSILLAAIYIVSAIYFLRIRRISPVLPPCSQIKRSYYRECCIRLAHFLTSRQGRGQLSTQKAIGPTSHPSFILVIMKPEQTPCTVLAVTTQLGGAQEPVVWLSLEPGALTSAVGFIIPLMFGHLGPQSGRSVRHRINLSRASFQSKCRLVLEKSVGENISGHFPLSHVILFLWLPFESDCPAIRINHGRGRNAFIHQESNNPIFSNITRHGMPQWNWTVCGIGSPPYRQ